MNKNSSILWLAFALILLLPTTAGRFLLDLAGSLVLGLIALPIILGGIGWVGWRILQSQTSTCPVCGASSLNNSPQCPFCGSTKPLNKKSVDSNDNIPASSATIDITAQDTRKEN